MTEGNITCPVCNHWNVEYFDGSTQVDLDCENCGSHLCITDYALSVDIHNIDVVKENNLHELEYEE